MKYFVFMIFTKEAKNNMKGTWQGQKSLGLACEPKSFQHFFALFIIFLSVYGLAGQSGDFWPCQVPFMLASNFDTVH